MIGTAFDPEMQGDLRVTMVATGLCDSSSPKPVVEKPVKAAPPPPKEEKAEEKLPKGAMVPPRKFARAGGASMAEAAQLDLDHLEIPAFLRRQAD